MHDLAHGPAAVAIRGVELGFVRPADRGAQALGKQAQSFNLRGADAGRARGGRTETPDGIAKIVLIGHAKNVNTPGAFGETRSGTETRRLLRRTRRRSSAVSGLRVVMMVVMMVVVMGPGGERGTCKHHQEQSAVASKFLHKSNPSTRRLQEEGHSRSDQVLNEQVMCAVRGLPRQFDEMASRW